MSAGFDPGRVAARKLARESAAVVLPDILACLDSEAPNGYRADYAAAFVEAIAEAMPKRAEPAKPPELTVRQLGATKLKHGSYAGKTYDEAPLEYIGWLCRENEETLPLLRAYLKQTELR